MAASDPVREFDACVRRREVGAELGRRAVAGVDRDRLLADAAIAVRETPAVDSCAILESSSDRSVLSVRANAGRDDAVTGSGPETVRVSDQCQLGYALETADLDDVCGEALTDLEVKIAESAADVSVESLPRVRGDAGQLRQVFQNRVSNAITDSGDEPPRIRISATGARADPDPSSSSGSNSNSETPETGAWVVSVRDEGIGIDPADAGRIFEVFDRLHSVDEYPGIGLALCQRIVERHGGEIRIDSEPGDRTTFSFTLPAAGERDTGDEERSSRSESEHDGDTDYDE